MYCDIARFFPSEATKEVMYEVRPLVYTHPVPKGQENLPPYLAIFASTKYLFSFKNNSNPLCIVISHDSSFRSYKRGHV